MKTELELINQYLQSKYDALQQKIDQNYKDQCNPDNYDQWNEYEQSRDVMIRDRDVIQDLISITIRNPVHATNEATYTIRYY